MIGGILFPRTRSESGIMANPLGQAAADGPGIVPSVTIPPVKMRLAAPPLVSVFLGSLSPETIKAWILCVGVGVEIGVAVGVGEPIGGLVSGDGLGVGGDGGGGAETSVGPGPGSHVRKPPDVGRTTNDPDLIPPCSKKA
jgi:hypothetical protein